LSIVDSILQGSIDMHVHCAPDPFVERREDALRLAYRAREAGMRVVVLKCHYCPTSLMAYIANEIVENVQVFGSITLNREIGGLNPYAVEAHARLGAKVVWMPTVNSVPDMAKRGEQGISLIDEAGALVAEVRDILDIIKAYGIILATGHISAAEIDALCREAARMGIKHIITHPLVTSVGGYLPLAKQKELADKGAIIEHTYVLCMPFVERADPMVIADAIRTVGVEHCILSSDFGQVFNPSVAEGARMMIAAMLRCGLSRSEVEVLVKHNPAKLLDLK
jgi:hypothetical protein